MVSNTPRDLRQAPVSLRRGNYSRSMVTCVQPMGLGPYFDFIILVALATRHLFGHGRS